MKPPLRPVDPSTLRSVEMADAIEAIMRECIAQQPITVMVIWETSKGMLEKRSVPSSEHLRRGIIDAVFRTYWPQEVLE